MKKYLPLIEVSLFAVVAFIFVWVGAVIFQ